MTQQGTLLLVDHSPIYRTGFRAILEQDGAFKVEESSSLDDAVLLAETTWPDLVLSEIVGSPAEVVQRFKHASPSSKVVLLSMGGRDIDLIRHVAAVEAGGLGVIERSDSPETICAMLRAVLAGAPIVISALIYRDHQEESKRLLEATCPHCGGTPPATLTPREQEIAELVADGLSNPEIAKRLFISSGTVKTHLHKIYAKVEVANRIGLQRFINQRRSQNPASDTS